MKLYEIFDGPRYLLTVLPSEDPLKVLESERKQRRNHRLSMIQVENGQRSLFQGPSEPQVTEEEEEFDFEEGDYDE